MSIAGVLTWLWRFITEFLKLPPKTNIIIRVALVCSALISIIYGVLLFSLLPIWKTNNPEYSIPKAFDLSTPQGLMCSVLAAFIFAMALLTTIYLSSKNSDTDKDIDIDEQTIHVLLPLTGIAQGDGLLQAAGFLSAKDVYTSFDIKFHDTRCEQTAALEILDRLIKDWKRDRGNLWVVITMSVVASGITAIIEQRVRAVPGLIEKFTMFITVANAPKIDQMPELGVIRFSMDGRDEADKIHGHFADNREMMNLSSVLLVSTNSIYSTQTIDEIAHRLNSEGIPYQSVPYNSWNTEVESDLELLKKRISTASIAVVVGYDMELFSALKSLTDLDFKGEFIASATLSVPDWQQYLKESAIWTDECVYKVLQYRSQSDYSHSFETSLKRWTFDTIVAAKDVYKNDVGERTAQNFSEQEREVYKLIEPNYISALCFDTVRAFHAIAASGRNSITKKEDMDDVLGRSMGPLGYWKYSSRSRHPLYVPSAKLNLQRIM